MAGPIQISGGHLQMFAANPPGSKRLNNTATGSDQTPGNSPEDIQLKKACSDLESLFIYQLFQEMRKTVSKSGFINEGQSGPMVNSMMDMELSKELANQKGIGLASILYEQLSNYQKAAKP